MKRLTPFLLVLLFLAVTLAVFGCRPATPTQITAVDDVGRAVYIPQTPTRVVSLAPSITEIMFALGLGDTVVGVTENCDYPEEAKAKPKVGRYFATSLEAILGRDPDLILTDGYDPVWQQLQNWGIAVLVLQPKDIYGIFRDIQVVGKVMKQEKVAVRLVAELQERLNKVVERTARAESKPTVFFELDATNPATPWTGGPGSFVDILISLAGGMNIVKAPGAWVQLSLEELFYADPDIVVLGDYPYVKPQQVGERGGAWPKLTAVESGRVYAISDPNLTSRPGPRIIDGLEELARIIHPELFP